MEITMMNVYWKPFLCLFLAIAGCNSSALVSQDKGRTKERPIGQFASQHHETSGGVSSEICDTDEAVLFQCQSGGKSISVCGRRMANGESKIRFVLEGMKNINVSNIAHPDISWASQGYSGGGAIQIRIQGEGREIFAYSRVVRTQFESDAQHDPHDEAGVMERRHGRVVSHQKCDNPSDAVRYKADPAAYMRKGDFIPLSLP